MCRVTRVDDVSGLLATTGLIRRGSTGDAVAQLQRFLTTFRHVPGPVDGIFGSLTTTAVRSFQAEHDLAADGIVGSLTRAEVAVLVSLADRAGVLDPDGRILRQGAIGADVAELQGLLKAVGIDPGPADGVFGMRTVAAVRAFQDTHGMLIDGVVGPGTRSRLATVLRLTPLITCS